MDFYSDLDFNKTNIDVIWGGYVNLDSSWRYENCCQFFSRLYYVKNGSGEVVHGGKKTQLCGGKVYLIPANMQFSCSCEHLEKVFFHISVPIGFGHDLLEGIGAVRSLDFSVDEFNRLQKLFTSDKYTDMLSTKAIIYETVNTFIAKYCTDTFSADTYSPKMKNITSYVNNNLRNDLSCKEISKALFLSESSIRATVRRECKVTLNKYIENCLMYTAVSLIKSTDKTFAQISEELHFYDQFHFSRRFKKYFGKTPSQYRKETMI